MPKILDKVLDRLKLKPFSVKRLLLLGGGILSLIGRPFGLSSATLNQAVNQPAEQIPDVRELSDDAIAKLSSGALRRVLLQLRNEEGLAGDGTVAFSNHDSYVAHGSHTSHGSHGQHTSHSSSIA
jgi:hypothetical protein